MFTAPNWFVGTLVAVLAMVLALAGLAIARRLVSADVLRANHEVAGPFFQVVGTLYAVLLAFVVVIVWQQYQSVAGTVDREGTEVADLYRDAGELPEPARTDVRAALRAYDEAVVEEEWPAMQRGDESDRAWQAFDRLWAVYRAFPVGDMKQLALRQEMSQRLTDLSEDRRLRLLHTESRVHPALWLALVAGGLLTVGFSYFFTAPRRVHVLMTTMFAGSIAVILFVIVVIDQPFNGYGAIDPDAFTRNLSRWSRIVE